MWVSNGPAYLFPAGTKRSHLKTGSYKRNEYSFAESCDIQAAVSVRGLLADAAGKFLFFACREVTISMN